MKVRATNMKFAFGDDIPRHYCGGNILRTHILNGLHLINPEGERFFIRSVHYYLDRIPDHSDLKDSVRTFCAQEVHHGLQHERFLKVLEAQGYQIRGFLSAYERIAFRCVEARMHPVLRLSVTAALEHFTAVAGEMVLTTQFLSQAPPTVQDLFRWHAAEEIEHKSVAFDVLKKINKSYSLRLAGFVIGWLLLCAAWITAVITLVRQEEQHVSAWRLSRHVLSEIGIGMLSCGSIVRAAIRYVRPGFHPDDIDNSNLAELIHVMHRRDPRS